MSLRSDLRADLERLRVFRKQGALRVGVEALLFDNGFLAVILYRLAHWCRSRRIPVLGPGLARLAGLLTGVEISPQAEIGPGLVISHGRGIVIGGWARIGANATLLQGVTLGGASPNRLHEMPRVGDNVFVGAGAKLIGAIEVGDDAFIGVGALVLEDVPAGARVLAAQGVTVSMPGDGDADAP